MKVTRLNCSFALPKFDGRTIRHGIAFIITRLFELVYQLVLLAKPIFVKKSDNHK